jgi:hypothetical protein
MSRRLTRSYAHSNLEEIQPTAPVHATEQKWTQVRNVNDTDSEGEDVLDTPKGPKHS